MAAPLFLYKKHNFFCKIKSPAYHKQNAYNLYNSQYYPVQLVFTKPSSNNP